MKFAVALLVAVEAKKNYTKKDLMEAVHVHYPAETVKEFMGLGQDLMHNFQEAEQAFEKEYPNAEADFHKLEKYVEKRYGPEFEQWLHSGPVQASENHKRLMFEKSNELHQVMSDAFTLYNEAIHGGIEAGW